MDIKSCDDRNELFDRTAAETTSAPRNIEPHDAQPFDVGGIKFWAVGDRILVQEDEFKTGYECTACSGKCELPCQNCGGTGEYTRIAGGTVLRCSECEGKGKVVCPTCKGKGGLIIAPEITERRPTTGQVVSAGPDCRTLHVGYSVLYSNFAGYVVDLNRAGKPVTIRILHEKEVLARMEGHLTLANLKGKTDISLSND